MQWGQSRSFPYLLAIMFNKRFTIQKFKSANHDVERKEIGEKGNEVN